MRFGLLPPAFIILLLLTSAATAYAEISDSDSTVARMESGFWLTTYEHQDPRVNAMAESWVLGFYQAAQVFGGVQCPQELSAHTLAAATADVIRYRKRPKENALIALLFAAHKVGCSLNMEAMRQAPELLEKKWRSK
jgi:hypothetical protein